jgi:hypothetical protein
VCRYVCNRCQLQSAINHAQATRGRIKRKRAKQHITRTDKAEVAKLLAEVNKGEIDDNDEDINEVSDAFEARRGYPPYLVFSLVYRGDWGAAGHGRHFGASNYYAG